MTVGRIMQRLISNTRQTPTSQMWLMPKINVPPRYVNTIAIQSGVRVLDRLLVGRVMRLA
jgi:hypothetical protein